MSETVDAQIIYLVYLIRVAVLMTRIASQLTYEFSQTCDREKNFQTLEYQKPWRCMKDFHKRNFANQIICLNNSVSQI